MKTSPVIQAKQVSLLRQGHKVLDTISLHIHTNRLTMIIGPNGAGKTTLLHILSGLRSPHEGELYFDSKPLHQYTEIELAQRRSVMTQEMAINFPFTVRETVRFGLNHVHQSPCGYTREKLVDSCLELTNLTALSERSVLQLSGGEKQRVYFARALTQLKCGNCPQIHQVMFLDEPTAHMDLKHQIDLCRHAKRLLTPHLAVCMIVHDLNLAMAYADHILCLSQGRLKAEGPPQTVITDKLLHEVFQLPLHVAHEPTSPYPHIVYQT